jgi:hypothetical protein
MRHGKMIEENEPNELLRKYNKIVRFQLSQRNLFLPNNFYIYN